MKDKKELKDIALENSCPVRSEDAGVTIVNIKAAIEYKKKVRESARVFWDRVREAEDKGFHL